MIGASKNSASAPSRATILFVVTLLLLAQAAALAHSATVHSPTALEPAFLVSGLSHWELGRFELYRVNPPLPRMIAALPVYCSDYKSDWSSYIIRPGTRLEIGVAYDFLQANSESFLDYIKWARWAALIFPLIGGCYCFLWGCELSGTQTGGLIAVLLWVVEPNILAHGELITADMASCAIGLGALYHSWHWIKAPSLVTTVEAGLMIGLLQLTKMT